MLKALLSLSLSLDDPVSLGLSFLNHHDSRTRGVGGWGGVEGNKGTGPPSGQVRGLRQKPHNYAPSAAKHEMLVFPFLARYQINHVELQRRGLLYGCVSALKHRRLTASHCECNLLTRNKGLLGTITLRELGV